MEERGPYKAEVTGSIPVPPTTSTSAQNARVAKTVGALPGRPSGGQRGLAKALNRQGTSLAQGVHPQSSVKFCRSSSVAFSLLSSSLPFLAAAERGVAELDIRDSGTSRLSV